MGGAVVRSAAWKRAAREAAAPIAD
jgi:hypothetical protein